MADFFASPMKKINWKRPQIGSKNMAVSRMRSKNTVNTQYNPYLWRYRRNSRVL